MVRAVGRRLSELGNGPTRPCVLRKLYATASGLGEGTIGSWRPLISDIFAALIGGELKCHPMAAFFLILDARQP